MSMAVGTATTISPPKEKMGFDDDEERREAEDEVQVRSGSDQWDGDKLNRQVSEASFYGTDDDDDEDQEDEDEGGKKSIVLKPNLGPLCTLKEHLEKDKDDESLRRWKEQLLGSVDFNSVGESLEPEVRILSLSITSPGRPELVLPMPLSPDHSSGPLFVLKEGSRYSLKFSFLVSNNIVSGLKYTNTVWKTGLKVVSTKIMLGTFSPQQQPYTYMMAEEVTPSGIFARGTYSARSKT
ncbi:Rho GDP-dissociation inhibitor 1 [Nymphaea thermarum]|nr:Rho GDP-dissociation inhibitor 1 [Nymphaea thermarum]